MRCLGLSLLSVLLVPSIASAHIRITSPTPRSTTALKEKHCGQAGSKRANVQTMKPGATMHLVWDEYIAHPGWYRVAFQQNGDVFETPAASNGPSGSGGAANFPTENLTGRTDAATGSLILADRIQHPTVSLDVVLPNVECTSCTLQLIQVMTDSSSYDNGSIYYACVDLVLSAGAPEQPPIPTDPDPDPVPEADAGGCSASGGGAAGGWAVALVGAVAWSRRRSKRSR